MRALYVNPLGLFGKVLIFQSRSALVVSFQLWDSIRLLPGE
jgi:hypothetical protein